ncbi:MAG: hypothetical protein ABMA64_01950 [Myxococcota bacterium]
MSSGRRALGFVAGGLGIHAALYLFFVVAIARDHDVRKMDQRWLVGPRDVEVMIAGDSHARYAVEAPILGRAINVAVPGEHYQKSLYRVPWLLDNGSRSTRAIVLPFDGASFASFKADAFSPEYLWGRYVDWFDLGRMRGQRWVFFGKWLKARAVPYLGEYETTMQWFTSSRHFRDQNGPGGAGLNLVVAEPGAEVARRHLGSSQPWDPVMVTAFRRLIDQLKAKNIRVILVRFPMTRDYSFELQRLGSDPASRDALFAELGEPGVVDQLDYESLYFGEVAMFGDGDHLSAIGKRKFSLTLGNELFRMGVLSSPPQVRGGSDE